MSKRKIGLHEVAFERLAEAETHAPHAPTEMISGNSRGPVKMWLCTRVRCHMVEYTYGEKMTPPTCYGGAQWSFSTDGTYRPGVHRASVQWEV